MRKIIVSAFALSCLLLSCTKAEIQSPDAPGADNAKLSVKVSTADPGTKTTLGEKSGNCYSLLWSAGDRILINGVESDEVPSESIGTTSATFTASAPLADSYNLLYPASAMGADPNTVVIPSVQTYSEANFAAGVCLAAGVSTDLSDAELHNVMSFIKFTISNNSDNPVTSVAVNGNGSPVAGTFSIDYVQSEIVAAATGDALCIDGIGIAKGETKSMVIAIPAGTYTNGISVMIADSQGNYMSKSTPDNTVFTKGIIKNMPSFEFSADAGEGKVVMTADQWNEMAPAINDATWKTGDEIRIGADLDFAGKTFVQIGTLSDNVVLNGQGHSIKNLTTDKALVKYVNGTVKNIVIDESCLYNVPDVGFPFGTIAGYVDRGTVSGCVNNAQTRRDAGFTKGTIWWGGIAGVVKANGKILDCVNNGDVILNSPDPTFEYTCIGGVSGKMEGKEEFKNALIKNCVNNGSVIVTFDVDPSEKLHVGGIVGSSNVQGLATLIHRGSVESCRNNGEIKVEIKEFSKAVNSNLFQNVGGVAGYLEGELKDCLNTADVSLITPLSYDNSYPRPGIGGVAGTLLYSADNCVNEGNVTIRGSFFGGTQDKGGTGGNGNPSIGGVIGCMAVVDTLPAHASYTNGTYMKNCINRGLVTVENTMNKANNTHSCIGGVAGWCGPIKVSDCRNYGKMDIVSGFLAVKAGGIAGVVMRNAKIENCENYGEVVADFNKFTTELSQHNKNASQAYISGIVGFTDRNEKRQLSGTGIDIVNCHNHAPISLLNGWNDAAYSYAGGIFGNYCESLRMTGCTNEGAITVDTQSGVVCGGLCAAFNGTMKTCSNTGSVLVRNAGNNAAKPAEIGGLIGYANATLTDCSNTGSVKSEAAGSNVGGIVGGLGANKTWTRCSVDCTVVASGAPSYAGSLLGRYRGNFKLTWQSGTIAASLASMQKVGNLSQGSDAVIK